ncbi:snapalysin family zinc-dependent metalloprotease [Streptomyces griseiscabiei]|uniref:Extracellular small neutral protease n=1 Tax=Streptomyces griseiscabiei TaxID=2993540 RepID=A0ABU4L610_9ACTN|nr:snapalysin family zinc-dependent metalloprotease [Streptomyces griseiscabiei]MBZ3906214.1 snapalysin family zinc-dependent metalloprotease [Streptomyces griseiscabiei]MDX2911209.1 snapalysin family zinc-dependent metalloprotease [Streptomyces griseiscabiei]
MVRVLKPLSAVVIACAALTGVGTPAGAAAPEPEIIPIDLLLAGSYTDASREAIAIWNKAVPTIKFVEQDTPAALRVMEYTTARGVQSHVNIKGAGRGWVYLEVGDARLYKPTRIVVHELGHILSLPDAGRGPCSKVMTGAAGGADCPNDQPDAAETAAVADFFAKYDVGARVPWWASSSATR